MKYIMLICKGFIIGVAKIIPGVSGAIIAISFGVYERLVNIMSRPTKLNFNDLKFLVCLLIGAALGIGLLCKVVKWCLEIFYLPTMLLFVGLIFGGISEITNKIKTKRMSAKSLITFICCFSILYYLVNIQGGNGNVIHDNFVYFLIGIIESATTIIPGISGTAIFIALGWYENLLSIFEGITNFSIDFFTLCLFLSGFIISTVLIAKIINYIFKHKREIAYCCVFGFMSSSLLVMLINSFTEPFTIIELLFGICLFIFSCWVYWRQNK